MPNEASDLGNGASADEEALGPSFAAESPVRFSLLSFSSFLSYGFYYKYDMNEIPLYRYSAPLSPKNRKRPTFVLPYHRTQRTWCY